MLYPSHLPGDPFSCAYTTPVSYSVFLLSQQFVLGIFGATYYTAAKLTNDETEKWSLKVYTGAWWQTRLPSSEEMQRLARLNLTEV